MDYLLWNDIKIMFEPHVEDEVWKLQNGYKVLEWKLYDSCGVHFLRMQSMHIYMLVEKKYPLTLHTLSMMLEKKLQIDYESEMAYQLCTSYDVRDGSFMDIAARIIMEYLSMSKWSNLDKKRAQVMVHDIDRQLYQRRLMRNLEIFYTIARIHVKEILLKLNLPDHMSILMDSKILKDGGEGSVIVKEFQERCLIQAFKTKKQQQYEHVGTKVTSSQDGKVYKMEKRDYAWLMISRCSRSHSHIRVKIKEQAQA
ncbi:hypothetical protein Tco_1065528 [Tanacetum coccineum]